MSREMKSVHGSDNGSVAERVAQRPVLAPPVDIYENKDEILLVADLPGTTRDDVAIRLEKDELALHARRAADAAGAPLSRESRTADYARTFLVPPGIDAEKISADLKNGVLTVRLPKSDALKPRRIQVRAS